ncbi:hypothetical protein BCR43DRAFT_508525 [Syncephalastrum racemosum]|uniref:Putative lipoate-protein ligase A n=1 Tax=Syncephalastrum racemosum TaxID=13706 RepID=A0A1X2H0U7_SYNRA|nr:hypothetical protein BCR43DRAFT_508525 [Syncephalastrum racemosum]
MPWLRSRLASMPLQVGRRWHSRSSSSSSSSSNSSSTGTITGTKVQCYISKYTDPYTNLALEEWLLRETDPDAYILYLWRNSPCVVVGRNQNPFVECNLRFMRENNIPLVRRRSGGGAVYHVT